MHVIVDYTSCDSQGLCVSEAPAVFDLDDDTGDLKVLTATPGEDERPNVERAAFRCPKQAITVEG